MKAVRIEKHGGPEVMQIVDVPEPKAGDREVRVKVEAAGLNYSDVMIREGTYVDPMPLPYLMGREFCGVVDQVGSDAQGYVQPGQRVVGSVQGGAMAEYVVASPFGLVPCPDDLAPEQGAALLIQGITAVHMIDDVARVQSGETVLIHAAAGGVGTLAVQIARARGATVLGTTSKPEKCKVVEDLGGTAINYSEEDWVAKVKELTDGRGADAILESVGGEVFRKSFEQALAMFGRMVVYGVASGQLEKLHNLKILESNRTISGYYLGSYFPKHLDKVAAATQTLMGMIAAGQVKPIIGKTFPLDRVVEAFDFMQQRESHGKVVILP